MRIVEWVRNNKLTTLLLVVLAIFVAKSFFGTSLNYRQTSSLSVPAMTGDVATSKMALPGISGGSGYGEVAPTPEVKKRMVVSESNLSLLVKNVSESLNSIRTHVTEAGGYMVESSLTRPQDAPSGQITVRVPSNKLDEVLEFFRRLSIKVVSENLTGTDVTDQFVDNEARMQILVANKTRFEEIMKKAEKVDEILRVQQEIFSIQSQIDSIKGQQNYLEKTAESARVTIYLSTDELALPYAPAQPWRPDVVFKLAIRAMFTSLQGVGTALIWIVVYSVIWVPLLIVGIVLYKKFFSPKNPS